MLLIRLHVALTSIPSEEFLVKGQRVQSVDVKIFLTYIHTRVFSNQDNLTTKRNIFTKTRQQNCTEAIGVNGWHGS